MNCELLQIFFSKNAGSIWFAFHHGTYCIVFITIIKVIYAKYENSP